VQETERAFIGLGANVGRPRAQLEQAVAALAALPGAHLDGVSRLYRSAPVGPVAQGDFLNAAAALRVPGHPGAAEAAMALLVALKGLERTIGRVERERWGPREIDLDLLLFGAHRLSLERDPDARSSDPARAGQQWLQVPHPSAAERLFVLAPLADLAPQLEPPGWGMSVATARGRAEAVEGSGAVAVVGEWDAAGGRWRDVPVAPSAGSGAAR
jgi:2-amino-4-hydroxy-6-hydroxymethyldihydropteridine diphosphokinase